MIPVMPNRRLSALLRKEVKQIGRDRSTALVAIALPLLLLLLFGYGVSFDPRHFDIAVVAPADRPDVRAAADTLRATGYFGVLRVLDRREAERALRLRRVDGYLVFPETRGHGPAQLVVDGSEPNTAALLQVWVGGALARETARVVAGPRLEERVWFNPGLRSRDALVPGALAIILTIVGALLTALVIAREWERGTMEALLATPVRRWELLASKYLPYFGLGLLVLGFTVVVAVFGFGVPFRGSLTWLLAVSSVFLLCALGQGLLISTMARAQLVAAQVSVLTAFLPAFYFSDFVFELRAMPLPLQWLSWVVPARHFVSALQTLFLAGDVTSILVRDLLAMAVLAAGLFAATWRATRMKLA